MDNPNIDGYDDWSSYASSGGINSMTDAEFSAHETDGLQGDLYPEDDEE